MKKFVITSIIFFLIQFAMPLAFCVQYKYDNLHRLTRVVYDNGIQITYTYDEVGNRTQRVSTLVADASIDGSVDFKDFAIVASRWLEEDCDYPDEWCSGADVNWNSEVGIEDLGTIAQQWLASINP